LGAQLGEALVLHRESTLILQQGLRDEPAAALGESFDYLMQTGYLFGGWHLAQSALVAAKRLAEGSNDPFYNRKLATASFYGEQILPRCRAHAGTIAGAAAALTDYPVDWL